LGNKVILYWYVVHAGSAVLLKGKVSQEKAWVTAMENYPKHKRVKAIELASESDCNTYVKGLNGRIN